MTGSRPALLADGPGGNGIQVLPTDLRREALGLDPAVLASMAAELDLVVHCAAATGFNLDPATYRAVNVEGTARVLALAERAGPRPVPLLHVSTAYVCGECFGPVAEAPPAPGTRFANGYEASKAEAEHLVLAARQRGLPVAIARPSVVVGAWADGGIARYDNLYGLIRLVAEGRVRTLPAAPGASLDMVPIDHVVHGLADIAASMGAERMGTAAGRIFHLVSGAPVPVALLRDLALSYPQFQAPCFVPAAGFDPASLGTAEAMWHGRVAALYATYLQRDPRFADGNLRTLSGRACPPVDWAFLRRMIDRCIADGFLRAAA